MEQHKKIKPNDIYIKNIANILPIESLTHHMEESSNNHYFGYKSIHMDVAISEYIKNEGLAKDINPKSTLDKKIKEDINKNNKILLLKMLEGLIGGFKKEVLKLKEKGLTLETREALSNVRDFIDKALDEDSKHPLELEVEAILERAKQGLPAEVPYLSKKGGSGSPYEFLEKVYGKFLVHFTPTLVEDYIYLHQVKLIDEKFYKRLTVDLSKNNLTGIVPTKADFISRKIKRLTQDEIEKMNEIKRLDYSIYAREKK